MRKDADLAKLIEVPVINYWLGPQSHAVCYLLKGGELYNIVLICPDNLPEGVALQNADLEELHALFATWDPRLQKLLAMVQQTSKWKLQVCSLGGKRGGGAGRVEC
jgi:salicylate hydroxylase